MHVRRATKLDIPSIVHHRVEMFRSMGYSEDILQDAKPELLSFLQAEWDDSIECYMITENDEVIGGCAVSIFSRLPDPKHLHASKVAYIHNMFVEPEFRHQGKATSLMRDILEQLQKRGVYKVTLHDTELSRGIYRKLGFRKVENYYDLWIDSHGSSE
ncbi:MAG: GNAT family N-acetyltransferase [Promethearchaeota archaeon]